MPSEPQKTTQPPVQQPSGPAITSKNLPTEPVIARVDAAELDDSIVARPLAMPDFINVKTKNPGLSFRWVNWKAGDGIRYEQMKAMGWLNATPQDCQLPTTYLRDAKFVNGDLVLMKIDRSIYLGALKAKHQNAIALANPYAQHKAAAKKANSQLQTDGAGAAMAAGKIQTFVPSDIELARLGSTDKD